MPSLIFPWRRALWLALVLLPRAAWPAPPTWTADDAVRAALDRPAVQARLNAEVAAGRARIAQETATPTPRLGVFHEQVFGASQVAYVQTSAEVQQGFDLSGWRGHLAARQPHEAAALRADLEAWRLDLAAEARLAFYAVLHGRARLAALDAWLAQLDRGVTATSARQTRGDVAPYAVKRVARERAVARARRASEAGAHAEAWAALLRLTQRTERPLLDGTLAPDLSAPQASAVDATDALPQLQALVRTEQALSESLQAWGSPGLRGWSIGAGFRWAEVASQSGQGFTVSLSLPLALWNTDAPEIERLSAERARVQADHRDASALATARQRAALQRLEAAQAALQSLDDEEAADDLSQLAETAWRAGETTLAELLDAYASEAELELARADLQWAARRAEIERARSLGIGALP